MCNSIDEMTKILTKISETKEYNSSVYYQQMKNLKLLYLKFSISHVSADLEEQCHHRDLL